MNNKYTQAFKAAFPLTLPICAAFLFLGISYGFYICSKGFSPWYPFFTSALVYAGSMEFVLVTMLLSPFNPLYCFFMALMINSRPLFYGLTMLEKYKDNPKYFLTTKAHSSYADVQYAQDSLLIFGKETAGLPETLLHEYPESCIRTPMIEDARSLNLSNSVAIVAYEALRQNGFADLTLYGGEYK